MRISTRLSIISGVTMAMIVILTTVLVGAFIEFKNKNRDLALAGSLTDQLIERNSYSDQYFLYREDRLQRQWDKSNAAVGGLLRQAGAQFRGEQEQMMLERLGRSIEDTTLIFQRIVDNTHALKTAGANKDVFAELDRRLYSQLLLKINAVRSAAAALENSTTKRVERSYQHLSIAVAVFGLALALAVILFATQMDTLLRRRLLPLHQGVKSIAEGNLEQRIDSTGEDELADLANAINDMADKIRLSNQQLETEARERVKAVAMHESAARFKTWFELPLIGIAITSPTKGWIETNDYLGTMLGYRRDELVAMTWAELTHPDDLAQDAEQFERVMRGEIDGYSLEKRFIRKGGEVLQAALAVRCVRTTDGAVDYFVAHLQDITESKRLSEELDAHRHRLEEMVRERTADLEIAMQAADAANIAKSRFLATMSHEIRTPLNGIFGMVQMLLLPDVKEAARQDYAKTILDSGHTLLNLLNDILDLAKVEAGKLELDSVAFDAGQVVNAARVLFVDSARRKGLNIESAWTGQAGKCYLGDQNRLRQMVSNLVHNAIKFTLQGQIQIEATEVERDAGGAVLEFAVTDNGIGVLPDQHELLFQPFSQADSSTTRRHGGTGLGLSIVRALAEQMGGAAGVESRAGQGSRFWFRIRAGLAAADPDGMWTHRAGDKGHVASGVIPSLPGKVLVVEDDPTNRKVIHALLNELGLTAALAENGQQAVEAITGGALVDIILMDIQMPVMDGYEATRRIRQWEAASGNGRHAIIALSADAFAENRRRCLAAGVDDFLTKPIASLAALQAALEKWLPGGATANPAAPLPSVRPLDVARAAAIMARLEPLLRQDKFNAIACFKDLQEVVAGTVVAAEVAQANWMVSEFRFDQALSHLQQIAVRHGWEGVPHD